MISPAIERPSHFIVFFVSAHICLVPPSFFFSLFFSWFMRWLIHHNHKAGKDVFSTIARCQDRELWFRACGPAAAVKGGSGSNRTWFASTWVSAECQRPRRKWKEFLKFIFLWDGGWRWSRFHLNARTHRHSLHHSFPPEVIDFFSRTRERHSPLTMTALQTDPHQTAQVHLSWVGSNELHRK